MITQPWKPTGWLWLILSLYLLLTLAYSIVNPLFEAPDEHWHYFTTQFIADTGHLPAVTEPVDPWLGQEAAQPPLYYLLGAWLTAPLETAVAREQLWSNPFAWIGDASALTNINRFVHLAGEAWPWTEYALAAHLLRGLSALYGLGTLWGIYASGRLLWPREEGKALLTTALVAFWPQFNFIHSAISNDSLITLLCTLTLWQLLRLWQMEITRSRLLALGITIGLAALTKNAGVLLLVYADGFLWFRELHHTGWTKAGWLSFIKHLFWLGLPVLCLAGWLWWRNWMLYADPLATEPFVRVAGGDRGFTLWQVLAESKGLWLSLFAVFGWFNLRPPDWVYWVWNGLVVTAVAGGISPLIHHLILSLKRKESWLTGWTDAARRLTLLWVWLLLVYAGLLLFMMQTEAAQGRLLFPAILPLALSLGAGLSQWHWRGLSWLAPLLALATTIYTLFFVIAPAYARPPLIDALPPTATPLTAVVGNGLQLLGVEIETKAGGQTAIPGELVWFTLYWQATQPPAGDAPEFVLEILGRDLERVGHLHSYHGRGLYPATLWPMGKIVADRFAVRLTETAVTPVFAPVFVGLVSDSNRVRVGEIKIIPSQWPPVAARPIAELGPAIRLTAVRVETTRVRPGDVVTVTVQWQTVAAPETDVTTLVHLGPSGQSPLAVGDAYPLAGQYPARVWAAGEVIDDHYTLVMPTDLENGRYPLWLGLYDPQTTTPLPLSLNGVRQPEDIYLLDWITVAGTEE